jgi:UTP--glucose-1-phosphate uridylyltransferase
MRIKKAVFPVAGLGTRFLPATKASPKEMLTVVDKPLIQYAVEEAIEAGIEELIFVTNVHKRAIKDHFDKNFELEHSLEQKNKLKLLKIVKDILPSNISCVYVRQEQPLGLGDAILCAEALVGREPFAVLLADDLISNNNYGALSQMVAEYQHQTCAIVAVQEVPKKDTCCYGIVKADENHIIESIVEKPNSDESPSTQAVVGRYILTPEIFSVLRTVSPGKDNEIQLTDGIAKLLDFQRLIAFPFKGKRYDCGDKLGFLIANFDLACKDKFLGKKFMEYVTKEASQYVN